MFWPRGAFFSKKEDFSERRDQVGFFCLFLEEVTGIICKRLLKTSTEELICLTKKRFETDFMARQATVCSLSCSNWEKQEGGVEETPQPFCLVSASVSMWMCSIMRFVSVQWVYL